MLDWDRCEVVYYKTGVSEDGHRFSVISRKPLIEGEKHGRSLKDIESFLKLDKEDYSEIAQEQVKFFPEKDEFPTCSSPKFCEEVNTLLDGNS
jgi:hypothetical protein